MEMGTVVCLWNAVGWVLAPLEVVLGLVVGTATAPLVVWQRGGHRR